MSFLQPGEVETFAEKVFHAKERNKISSILTALEEFDGAGTLELQLTHKFQGMNPLEWLLNLPDPPYRLVQTFASLMTGLRLDPWGTKSADSCPVYLLDRVVFQCANIKCIRGVAKATPLYVFDAPRDLSLEMRATTNIGVNYREQVRFGAEVLKVLAEERAAKPVVAAAPMQEDEKEEDEDYDFGSS